MQRASGSSGGDGVALGLHVVPQQIVAVGISVDDAHHGVNLAGKKAVSLSGSSM